VYRYEYAKARHGRNFKVNCPSCGGIKRFNLFYDNKEDRLCDSQYGKCDRVYQCGYENRPQGQTVLKQDEIKTEKPPLSVMPLSIVKDSIQKCWSNTDALLGFIMDKWGVDIATKVFVRYNLVSVPFNGGFAPMFWFIDDKKQVRSGKIMNYESREGEPRRTKHDKAWKNVKWLHSKIDKYNFEMCFYGSHILTMIPDAEVHIVESEKTALIMSCVKPQHIWLATSSVTNLQEHFLPNLKDRKVVLHPDKGERSFGYWKLKSEEFKKKNLAKSINVSTFVQDTEFLGEGDDLADYVLKTTKYESTKKH